jgi:hypothetical protein
MKKNISLITIILIIVVGASYIYFNDTNKKSDSNLKVEKKSNEEIQKQEEKPEENINQESNSNTLPPSNSNVASKTKDNLKCTKKEVTEYGDIYYTNTYKFKADKMTYGETKIEMKLNNKYTSSRDQLLTEIKNANKSFVALNGISDSSTKNSKGFVYILKIDGTKTSATDLNKMGYRTLNYAGVKIFAFNNKFKCE